MTDADDIRTIIENDVDYRKRLLTTEWARHLDGRELMIEPLSGAVLDALGVVHHLPRKHTHICSMPPKGISPMKKSAVAIFIALPLLGACNLNGPSTVTSVNNTLANLAKNDIPVACGIIHVAEGYFNAVKGLVPPAAVTAEAGAAAAVAVICANPPTDIQAAFAVLLDAWTKIQAATTVPKS